MTGDRRHMALALRLAARGRGATHPNPMVGAVIVRDGEVLSKGWHHRVGAAHAEVDALQPLLGRAPGATMYVNLEPCCHHGRTPPCTDAILQSGIERVVVAMVDPNPLVDGKGLRILEAAGVRVTVGVLEAQARELNHVYVTWATRARPHVTLKVAATADGRTATREGDTRWITSEEARAHAHRRRGEAQAILVGSGTILADDPALTARPPEGTARQPARVVLDGRLRTPPTARVMEDDGVPVWIFTAPSSLSLPQADVLARRVRLVAVGGEGKEAGLDLRAALGALYEADIADLIVEGGPTVTGAFLDAGLADRWQAYLAPTLVGGAGALPMIAGSGASTLARAARLDRFRVARLGPDLLIEGAVQGPPPREDPCSPGS